MDAFLDAAADESMGDGWGAVDARFDDCFLEGDCLDAAVAVDARLEAAVDAFAETVPLRRTELLLSSVSILECRPL